MSPSAKTSKTTTMKSTTDNKCRFERWHWRVNQQCMQRPRDLKCKKKVQFCHFLDSFWGSYLLPSAERVGICICKRIYLKLSNTLLMMCFIHTRSNWQDFAILKQNFFSRFQQILSISPHVSDSRAARNDMWKKS